MRIFYTRLDTASNSIFIPCSYQNKHKEQLWTSQVWSIGLPRSRPCPKCDHDGIMHPALDNVASRGYSSASSMGRLENESVLGQTVRRQSDDRGDRPWIRDPVCGMGWIVPVGGQLCRHTAWHTRRS
jgi:hypothetical protein